MDDGVSAVLLLRHDGAALLQHRDEKVGLRNAGMWVPPGGHSEPGETAIDCARRELREETGYDAVDLQFLMSFEDVVEGWAQYTLTFFWCWYDGIQSVACYEGQALAFIERSNAVNYPIPEYLIKTWDAAFLTASSITRGESSLL